MRSHVANVAFRTLLAWGLALLSSLAIAQAAYTTDQSDLWWNPAESGWGMQLVVGGDATFATLFVYDSVGQPTFYTATLSQSGSSPTWTGDLYRTTGPYFGAAIFNSSQVVASKVGTLSFARTTSDAATLQYSVDGVVVNKSVVRELLRNDNYTGTYATSVYMTTTNCSNSADNRAQADLFTITVNHSGSAMTITGSFGHRAACTYTGTYVQSGKVGAAGLSYTCADGDAGNVSFFELQKRPGVWSGRIAGHSITDACDYSGKFAGVVPL